MLRLWQWGKLISEDVSADSSGRAKGESNDPKGPSARLFELDQLVHDGVGVNTSGSKGKHEIKMEAGVRPASTT